MATASMPGRTVIQWEKDDLDPVGLVKIDLLGNRSLAVIRDTIAAVATHTGRLIDYAMWDPLSDMPTKTLIRRGDTMGCFYVESPATRLLLKKLWATMPAEQQRQAEQGRSAGYHADRSSDSAAACQVNCERMV